MPDADDDRDHQCDPGEPGQPLLGGQAEEVHHRRGAAGPAHRAGGVGRQEVRVAHAQRTGQRSGQDSQQRDEAAEEHRPHAPSGEQLLGQGDVAGAEVLGETLAEPLEQRHAELGGRSCSRSCRRRSRRWWRPTPTHTGLMSRVCRDDSSAALTSAISPGSGMPRLSIPMMRPTVEVHRQRWDGLQDRLDVHRKNAVSTAVTGVNRRLHRGRLRSSLAAVQRSHRQQEQADQQDRGGQHVDLRRHRRFHRRVDVQRIGDRRPADEVGDDEVVERQRERQHRRRDDARHDQRQRHLEERPGGAGAEVQRGVLQRPVEPADAGAHRHRDEADLEGHMGDDDRRVPGGPAHVEEQRQQRGAHHDLRRGQRQDQEGVHRLCCPGIVGAQGQRRPACRAPGRSRSRRRPR